MLGKLALLGTLGYAGYRYLKREGSDGEARLAPAVAGGPLSDKARVQRAPTVPTGGPSSPAYGIN